MKYHLNNVLYTGTTSTWTISSLLRVSLVLPYSLFSGCGKKSQWWLCKMTLGIVCSSYVSTFESQQIGSHFSGWTKLHFISPTYYRPRFLGGNQVNGLDIMLSRGLTMETQHQAWSQEPPEQSSFPRSQAFSDKWMLLGIHKMKWKQHSHPFDSRRCLLW